MGDNKDEIGPRKGFGLRDLAILVAGCAIAVAAAYGVRAYLDRDEPPLGQASQSLGSDRMFIDAGDADLVITGRKIYEANCANCHGYDLAGQPNWRQRRPDGVLPAPPHDETGHTWHHSDATLFATVKLGGQAFMPQGVLSGMPAYRNILSDREIEAALAYIKSHWPGNIRRRQEMRTNQSR